MQRIRHPFVLLLALAALAGAGATGCASSQEEAGTTAPRTEIHYSSGGGVSGMSSGFSILHDGTVTQWTGRGATINDARVLGRLDAGRHASLLAFLEKAALAELQQQETGNMTTSLRIVRGEEEFLYTWPGLHLRKEEVPPSVRSLVETVWGSIEPYARQTP